MCQRTTITIKKKGVQRRIVSNNNRCPCPTKRTKRRVQLSTYLYECSKWSSSAFAGDIICHRTAQNAEIGTETVTITCRETAIIFVSLCCVSRRIEAPTHLTETLLLLLLFFLLSVVLLCDSDNVQRFQQKKNRLPTQMNHAADQICLSPIIYTLYFRQQFLNIKWNKAIRCLGCNRRKNILWEKINIFGKRLTENRICQSRNGSFLGQFFQLILSVTLWKWGPMFYITQSVTFFFLFTLAFWN